MSVFVIATFKATNFESWKVGFDRRKERYRQFGLLGYQLFRAVDDPDEVSLVIEFESLEGVERVMTESEGLRRELDAAGFVEYPAAFVGQEFETMAW